MSCYACVLVSAVALRGQKDRMPLKLKLQLICELPFFGLK